jgi:hypothetical protein
MSAEPCPSVTYRADGMWRRLEGSGVFPPNRKLLLSRKSVWVRCDGARAGRAAEFRVVRKLDSCRVKRGGVGQ